jgi:hypothetical protein
MVRPAATAGGLAALTVALHFRDPHEKGSWGICPLALVGIHCPGCGGLRAVNDLTHQRFADAASSNLLFVVSIPVLVWIYLRWTAGRWTGRSWEPSRRWLRVAGALLAASAVVFMVLRNTPAGSWLAP